MTMYNSWNNCLEFAVKGKLSINAGITQYSRSNITMDHYNQKSYFKSLENINKIKKLSKKQQFS